MSEQDNLRVIDEYFEALNTHDYGRVSRFHGEGYQFQAPDLPTWVDNEGNRTHFQQMIDLCSDLAMDPQEKIAGGDYVVVNFAVTGTNDGPIAMPTGQTIPATGRKAALPVSDTLLFKDGKIVRQTLYYDQMGFMMQLGLMPGM